MQTIVLAGAADELLLADPAYQLIAHTLQSKCPV